MNVECRVGFRAPRSKFAAIPELATTKATFFFLPDFG